MLRRRPARSRTPPSRLDDASTTAGNAAIVGLFTAPKSAAPMLEHTEVELIACKGILGDRYAEKTGSYSSLRWSAREPGEREPGRQLTLISADAIDASLSSAGLALPTSYGEFRRNVVLRGYTANELLALQGSELLLGPTCRVFVHRHCVPCFYNERLCGRPGQLEAIFLASGVSCEVLVGGALCVNDVVKPAPHGSPGHRTERDLGTQPPGYYVRPSKRTAAMAKCAHAQMVETLKEMMRTDPAGAARAEAAYNSVGIGFWPASAWQQETARRRHRMIAKSVVAGVLTASAVYFAWS